MEKAQAKKEIQRLVRQVEEHNERYYNLDQPTISDREYDGLLKRLVELEEEFPKLRDPQSPSQRVGIKVQEGAPTVRHRAKMYSLDNTYSMEELKKWFERVNKGLPGQRVEFVVELKIDGVSAALTYENGQLIRGATRGDGITGEDVTHNVKTIRSIPLGLKKAGKTSFPKIFDVRAEIFMLRTDFEKLNEQRQAEEQVLFANPRNATSGSVKLLDSRITAKRNLQCFVHSLGAGEGGRTLKTQWDFLQKARRFGFLINPESRLCEDFAQVIAYCRKFEEKRTSLKYEVDGVVIKVNDLHQQNRLGSTLKSPRWAVAYKFPAHQATTWVKKITVQVGRTGVLTPVAELEPVSCAGVIIARSTLHNFDEVKRLGVKVGDHVLVERAGDVIPKIVKVVESAQGKGRLMTPPKNCPACGAKIAKEKAEQVAYRCINPSCPKQLERSLLHFASRGAMDIEGLGVSVVQQLLDKGMIKDLADIYGIRKEDLLSLELFKDKKADNLLTAIANSKRYPLSRFLYGLGIVNIGEKAASILAQRFGRMDRLVKATPAELEAIHEVGTVMALSLNKFFKQPATKRLIAKFKKYGVKMTEPTGQGIGYALRGKKFVFTGELPELTRSQASALVRQLGGEVVAAVSRNVDFVVAGENPGSKYKKALNLGVTILDPQKFQEMTDAKGKNA